MISWEEGEARRCYYWVHHTSEYDGNSGVQRVVRNLAAALPPGRLELIPVTWCPVREAIIHAERSRLEVLGNFGGPRFDASAVAGQPIHLADSEALRDAWLLMGEVPHSGGPAAPLLPVVFDYARYYGMRVAAIFYDLIPLRCPGYEESGAAHARYADALATADLVIPISQYSGGDLQAWWRERHIPASRSAKVLPLLLPEQFLGIDRVTAPMGAGERLCRLVLVGSVEPRKNQLAVLRAIGRILARRPDLAIAVDVVGHLHHAVAADVRDEIQRIGAAYHGYLPDAELRAMIADSQGTIFLSKEEGYGLPVAESLWLGRPCITSSISSMVEIAEGGGCLLADPRSDAEIEQAIERFVEDPELRLRLQGEAISRPLRLWSGYARQVADALDAMPILPRLAVITLREDDGLAENLASLVPRIGRFCWQRDSRALLPATDAASDHLRDQDWALVDFDASIPVGDLISALAVARALGMRCVIRLAGARPEAAAIAALADSGALLAFREATHHAAALARALKDLPRTIGVRDRFVVAADDAALLRELALRRPRLSLPRASAPLRRIFYWCGLTASQDFNTGIQRVVRSLAAGLEQIGIEVIPVRWDERRAQMVTLDRNERERMADWNGPEFRSDAELPQNLAGEWLVVPEITIPVLPPDGGAARVGRALGMRVAALFHDLIPLKHPHLYSEPALDNVRRYLQLFDIVDLALPVSWTVAGDLTRHLRNESTRTPTILPCPLAGEMRCARRASLRTQRRGADSLRLLAVGTLEPRKNYLRMVSAVAEAVAQGASVQLTIVGRHPPEYSEEVAELDRLIASVPAVRRYENVDDDQLARLFEEHDATIYASAEEGFGLPVLESLWRGLPCLCHTGSSLAEIAPGGGTLQLDMLDVDAIAAGITRLAADPHLWMRLAGEAAERPVPSWRDYAGTVVSALEHVGAAPGWRLPAVVAGRRPLLSCCITTYNRGRWLANSLPRLLEATRPWRDVVEVVVCDNASTDDTPSVVARHAGERNFVSVRNAENVGMLGNLGETARSARGAFVWILGDDDIVLDGAIDQLVAGLSAHPSVEMAYCNYSYTRLDAPTTAGGLDRIIATARPISPASENRFVDRLKDVAALNENLFTAIYTCIFRHDHALRTFQQDMRGAPFSSLATCVPSSVYALEALLDRPAYWIGKPAVMVNMNVSWLRWALLWHLERMPDLYELAEMRGVAGIDLEPYRTNHCADAGNWIGTVYTVAEDAIRESFSIDRFLERTKHLPIVRGQHLDAIRAAYADAVAHRTIMPDMSSPFRRYGLDEEEAAV